MMQGQDKWISLAEGGKLKQQHLWKLHSGYYSLVGRWERFRIAPPQCIHKDFDCSQQWQVYWKKITRTDLILNKSPADVLGRLGSMVSQLNQNHFNIMHNECKSNAVKVVQAFSNKVEEDLASIFVDISYVVG
jgi:hypothetical protein